MKEKFLNSSINFIKKNKKKKYTKEEIEIILYGLESLYLVITKAVIIFLIAFLLGIGKEVILVLIFYNILRSQAFGIHASKSSYCLISSITLFIGGAILTKFITIPYYISLTLSIICNILIIIYAPADTHKRPLINKKKRKLFKYKSIIISILYLLTIILFNKYKFVDYLIIGMINATIMILPITYKIFKLPYNNYKNYNV